MEEKKFVWYHNGTINKRIYQGEPIPDGFVVGLYKTEEMKKQQLEKTKQTKLERYGDANYVNSNKAKRTNLEKYGVENISQINEVKEKKRETMRGHYGVEFALQNNDLKNKAKQTCLEKYGVEYYNNQEKTKQTNLEKYGCENPFQNEDIKEKIKQTCLKKYGVEYYTQTDEYKEKAKQTNLKKYGVEYSSQSEDVKEKIKQTCLKKYGVEYYYQTNEYKEKNKKSNYEKYGVEYISQTQYWRDKVNKTCLEKYGVNYPCQTEQCIDAYFSSSGNSKPNNEFAKLLEKNNIEYSEEFVLEKYKYDFKAGDTLIEINPTITHNIIFNPFNQEPKDKKYHLNKTNCAKENGYRCIHIFDWDDFDKIIQLLKPRDTVYARNCIIKEINKKTSSEFLDEHHLQGYIDDEIRVGLFFEDKLVSLMTFGKPRYNKNYEYELLRYCSIKNVIGGEEKLFKYFVNNYFPKSIISYCDNSKFEGKIYEKLGFSKKENNPSKHWYNIKDKIHITDNLLRKRGFDQLFGTNFGKGTSNEELMIEHGFLPIYDCGQNTYTIIF